MAEKWYNLTPEQAAEKLNTDLARGLDAKSVAARLDKYGKNDVFRTPGASFISCVKAVGCDITAYLLVVLAVMSSIFNQNISAMVILVLLIINFAVTLFTYLKSQHILTGMSVYAAPMSRVIRGGRLCAVKQSALVVGDVVLLTAGDIVPADARIISSDGLCVLESELGGEAKAKRKNASVIYGENVPVGARTDMVLATSLVTEGSARILLCACGSDTFAAVTGNRREIVSHKNLKVLATLKKYCSVWSLCMLALILVVTALDLILGLESRGLFDIFITGASLACAAMSEFYVIFAYFIIGCGIFGTIKKRGSVNAGAVIKNISTLEEIKRLDTLIVPKRGGFFTDFSSLERLYCSDTLHRADEKRLYNYCGRLLKYALLSSGYAGNPAAFDDRAGEPCAIVGTAEREGIDRSVLAADYPLLWVGDTFAELHAGTSIVAGDGTGIALVRGEAAPLLEHCSRYFDDGDIKHIDDRERKRINEALRTIDEEDCRAVAVISRETELLSFDGMPSDEWILEGILGIREPVLPDAQKSIAACLEAGVQVIVLADEARDPSEVYFKRMGLVLDDSEIITSDELSDMKDDLFRTNLPLYKMYEGLTIPQKRLLIKHLRAEGRTVGVLGRELDDILLMRDADVGFSVGVTLSNGASSLDLGAGDSPVYIANETENPGGCEALKYACDVLVSPPERPRGGFNAMVKSLRTAKVIYQNLMRMVKYLCTSQIARLVIVLYSVIARRSWPRFAGAVLMTPAQILFCGLIVDLAVVLVIAFQRSPEDVLTERETTEERLERPFVHNFRPMLFGIFWGVAEIAVPLLFTALGAAISNAELTSLVFVSFVVTQLIVACEIIYENSLFARGHRINRVLAFVWIAAVPLFAAFFIFGGFGALFGITALPPLAWLCAAVTPVMMLALYELYKKIKR